MTDLEERRDPGGFVPEYRDVTFGGLPSFDSVEQERLHRKQRLAGGLRGLGRAPLAGGGGGRGGGRGPEHPGHFWVNSLGRELK